MTLTQELAATSAENIEAFFIEWVVEQFENGYMLDEILFKYKDAAYICLNDSDMAKYREVVRIAFLTLFKYEVL